MGYGQGQMHELETTLNAMPADLVLSATPIDLTRVLKLDKPVVRVRYELEEMTGDAAMPGQPEQPRLWTSSRRSSRRLEPAPRRPLSASRRVRMTRHLLTLDSLGRDGILRQPGPGRHLKSRQRDGPRRSGRRPGRAHLRQAVHPDARQLRGGRAGAWACCPSPCAGTSSSSAAARRSPTRPGSCRAISRPS